MPQVYLGQIKRSVLSDIHWSPMRRSDHFELVTNAPAWDRSVLCVHRSVHSMFIFQSRTCQSIISSIWTPPSKGSVLEWGMFLAQALHLIQISQRLSFHNVTRKGGYLISTPVSNKSEIKRSPDSYLIWMTTPGVILLNWIHTVGKAIISLRRSKLESEHISIT